MRAKFRLCALNKHFVEEARDAGDPRRPWQIRPAADCGFPQGIGVRDQRAPLRLTRGDPGGSVGSLIGREIDRVVLTEVGGSTDVGPQPVLYEQLLVVLGTALD